MYMFNWPLMAMSQLSQQPEGAPNAIRPRKMLSPMLHSISVPIVYIVHLKTWVPNTLAQLTVPQRVQVLGLLEGTPMRRPVHMTWPVWLHVIQCSLL